MEKGDHEERIKIISVGKQWKKREGEWNDGL